MLAEIFAVRLEAEARLVEEVLLSRTSPLHTFNLNRQFAVKKANHEGADALAEEPPVGLVQ